MDELTGARHETAKRDKIIAERERVNRMDQDACIALAEIGSLTAADSLEDYVSRAEVLLEFSVTLAEQLRPYDRLLRIDKDMFLVSLPYTDVDVAKIVMDRLHEKVTGGSLAFDGGTQITLEAHFDISPVDGGEEVEPSWTTPTKPWTSPNKMPWPIYLCGSGNSDAVLIRPGAMFKWSVRSGTSLLWDGRLFRLQFQ